MDERKKVSRTLDAKLAAERWWKYHKEIAQLNDFMKDLIGYYDPNIQSNVERRDCEAFSNRIIELCLVDEFNEYASMHGNYQIYRKVE